MSVAPIYNISTLAGTALIQVFESEQLFINYSYANDSVLLGEREEEITISLEALKLSFFNIRSWTTLIQKELLPQLSIVSPFEDETKKTSTVLTAKTEIDGELISDHTFADSTKNVTILARPAVLLNFSDFLFWVDFVLRFIDQCENF